MSSTTSFWWSSTDRVRLAAEPAPVMRPIASIMASSSSPPRSEMFKLLVELDTLPDDSIPRAVAAAAGSALPPARWWSWSDAAAAVAPSSEWNPAKRKNPSTDTVKLRNSCSAARHVSHLIDVDGETGVGGVPIRHVHQGVFRTVMDIRPEVKRAACWWRGVVVVVVVGSTVALVLVPLVVRDFQAVADPGHAPLVRTQSGDVDAVVAERRRLPIIAAGQFWRGDPHKHLLGAAVGSWTARSGMERPRLHRPVHLHFLVIISVRFGGWKEHGARFGQGRRRSCWCRPGSFLFEEPSLRLMDCNFYWCHRR